MLKRRKKKMQRRMARLVKKRNWATKRNKGRQHRLKNNEWFHLPPFLSGLWNDTMSPLLVSDILRHNSQHILAPTNNFICKPSISITESYHLYFSYQLSSKQFENNSAIVNESIYVPTSLYLLPYKSDDVCAASMPFQTPPAIFSLS